MRWRVRSRDNPEYHEQAEVVRWLKLNYPDVLFNSSPGGVRYGNSRDAAIRGAMMKRAGAKKGFPDIAIYEPKQVRVRRKGPKGNILIEQEVHGLFIEMKPKDGTPSDYKPEQREWAGELRRRGYRAEVCYGAAEAKKIIRAYMGKPKFEQE